MVPSSTAAPQDDKRSKLMQRKKGMFRRARSVDNLFADTAKPQQVEHKRGRRKDRRPLRRTISAPEGITTGPLISKRWESEKPSTSDKAPAQPGKRSHSKVIVVTAAPEPTDDRPKVSRWQSDRSMDRSPKLLLRPCHSAKQPSRSLMNKMTAPPRMPRRRMAAQSPTRDH